MGVLKIPTYWSTSEQKPPINDFYSDNLLQIILNWKRLDWMLQNHNQDDLNNYPSCLKDLTSLTLNLSLEIAQIVFQTEWTLPAHHPNSCLLWWICSLLILVDQQFYAIEKLPVLGPEALIFLIFWLEVMAQFFDNGFLQLTVFQLRRQTHHNVFVFADFFLQIYLFVLFLLLPAVGLFSRNYRARLAMRGRFLEVFPKLYDGCFQILDLHLSSIWLYP